MKKNITNSKMGTYELKIFNIHMKFFRLISTIIVIFIRAVNSLCFFNYYRARKVTIQTSGISNTTLP